LSWIIIIRSRYFHVNLHVTRIVIFISLGSSVVHSEIEMKLPLKCVLHILIKMMKIIIIIIIIIIKSLCLTKHHATKTYWEVEL